MLPKQEKAQQPRELVPDIVTCSMFLQLLKLIAIFLLTRDGLCHSLASVDKTHTYSFLKKGERRQEIGWIENVALSLSDLKFRKTSSCFSQTAGKTIIKMSLWSRGELHQNCQSGSLAEVWQPICFFIVAMGKPHEYIHHPSLRVQTAICLVLHCGNKPQPPN